ncbi:MAG: helix-turn-helix domain-containing protein [Steroidobacteraceae bacterium]
MKKRIVATEGTSAASPNHASNVVPLRPKVAKLRSEAKWGVDVMALGFCIVPSLLFRAQHRLGLKSTHLAVILQLAEFWWHDDNLPFPKKQTIAERLGLKDKQVQRLVRDLEQRGYVRRRIRKTPHGQASNFYDLSGLVKKLKELAPEFKEAADAKRKVERRGGLKTKSA